MSLPRLRMVAVAAAALLTAVLPGTAASAATPDRTPPAATRVGYNEGFYCLMLIVSADRSTDNVTPQSALRYETFDDGVFIGVLTDQNQESGVWGVLHLTKPGLNTVTVQVVDQAGNRSPLSRGSVVNGYYTPGCTPGHL